jgi:hypothetical protein
MRGFTIACILENKNSSSTTNNLKRKNSDDHHEHQPNKRQTIEGKNKYIFFIKISFQLVFLYKLIQ